MTFLQQTLLNSGWWQQSSLGDSGAHTPVTAPPAGQSSAHKRWDQLNTQIHSFVSILSVISFSPPRYLFKQHLKGKAWHLGRNSSSSVRSSRTFSTLANVLTRTGAVPQQQGKVGAPVSRKQEMSACYWACNNVASGLWVLLR